MDSDSLYQNCRLCPRSCGVDRRVGSGAGSGADSSADSNADSNADSGAYCGETSRLRLAFAGLHRGEEPPLSGNGGSGAIFVSGCNLGCSFCQNGQISQPCGQRLGREVSPGEFSAICLALQNKGAENINIVTGSHAIPAIAPCLKTAKQNGLTIPVLWNSSAYENPETLELINEYIDIYLPDLKTLDSDLAARFFNAPDYPDAAARAILWMLRHKPGGLIIRHLMIPGYLESTRAVLRWFADNAAGENRGKALLSLMSQYTPVTTDGYDPQRFVERREYETVIGWLEEFGIEDGFCQELVTGSDWLPDFTRRNPFSSDLSVPVWHFGDKGNAD